MRSARRWSLTTGLAVLLMGVLAHASGPLSADATTAADLDRTAVAPTATGSSPLLGQAAPFFALPAIAGGRQVESDTLFAAAPATVLAFWGTHCSECVQRLQACQGLQDWGEADGLQVIGINFDEEPTSRIQLLARQATPRMVQLHDPGARTAAAYGAGAHSFSIFIVDGEGIVRRAQFEISPQELLDLKPALMSVITEAFADDGGSAGTEAAAPVPQAVVPPPSGARRPGLLEELGLLKQQRLEAHGRGRIRWMNIDTTGVGATGSYGEAIEPGNSLRRRLELELAYAITAQLSAGGLIWLSNEGEDVLRSGPDYLSSPWGSAFVRYTANTRVGQLGSMAFDMRLGYYSVYFTPLTLMRWDKDDSPISGGQKVQGCACAGSAGLAGFIRSESVEKLAPEYRFEGAHVKLALLGRIDMTALYARPLERWRPACCAEADPAQCSAACATVQSRMQYPQELYAGRLTAHVSVPWIRDLAALSTTVVSVRDEDDNWSCCLYPSYREKNLLAGADLRLPLPARMELSAEFARSRWEGAASRPSDAWLPPAGGSAIEASALRGAWLIDARSGGATTLDVLPIGMTARLDLGYQRIEGGFYSPYSALSYETNARLTREGTLPGSAGPRASLRIEWGPAGLGAFLKDMRPVDEQASPSGDTPAGARRMTSLWLDCEVWPGGTLMAGWVGDERKPLAAQAFTPREERRTLVLSAEQELAARCTLLLEAQFLDGTRQLEDEPDEEYSSRTIRCLVDVDF